MNTIKITVADIAVEIIEKFETEEREKKRAEHIAAIELFTEGKYARVKVIQHLDEYFSWDEILMLSDQLVEKGYAVITARGYYCIEIPNKDDAKSRKPGVYCGDPDTLKTYVDYGINAHDIITKAPKKTGIDTDTDM